MVGSDDRLVLKVSAQADNLSMIRSAVEDRARELEMDEAAIADLKTVVSEACGNVVLHAYPGDVGERPLEVEMTWSENAVNVVVRDKGVGIRARTEPKRPSLSLGLQLIGAMASCFQIRSGRDRGTELLIQMPLSASA